jgi:hypothetical protein
MPAPAPAAPIHPPLPGLNLTGFNRACGVAVDSVGDVYVASAGDSKIRIYDPEHDELASIDNASEPCGLAVDSKGDLYVSESKTGNVVKYAAPSYGAPTTVDASGQAQGIAVDAVDDFLYVARGDRIAVYEPSGASAATIGLGQLTDATGVAAYTNPRGDRYVFAAENSTDVVKVFAGTSLASLSLRQTIDGSDDDAVTIDKTPQDGFGFGDVGAYLALDPSNGHLFLYDDEHKVLDEFEASGVYFTQIASAGFEDAEPTAVAAFPQRNEAQRVREEATGGTFKLEFKGEETNALPFNATATQVEAALEALVAVEPADVSVAGGYANAFASGTYDVAFAGALRARDVPQLACDPSALTGSTHTCTVATEVQGSGPGRVYVSAGAGVGAEVLTFGALPAPSRTPRPELSLALANACGVAVDSFGNRYVAADAFIRVYPPTDNEPLTTIADPGRPCDLAVDGSGHVYALNRNTASSGDEEVVYYTPAAFPPQDGTPYTLHEPPVATPATFGNTSPLFSIGIDSTTGRIFVNQQSRTIEFDSAGKGSGVLNADFASSLGLSRNDLDVFGKNGNVYIASETEVAVVDPAGTAVLARVSGAGSPKGPFGPLTQVSIAVDQRNGHLLIYKQQRGVVEEYEMSGAFVAEFGSFEKVLSLFSGIAVDNSGGPSDGNVYLAFDDTRPGSFDLTTFGPLSYGVAPIVLTGTASAVGAGGATLNGSVDPRGFALSDCHFDYTTEADFQANGFSGPAAQAAPCVPNAATIGTASGTVPVHAEISGLDPEGRYRFRLVAQNEFGTGEGEAGLFGPPGLTTRSAQPVSYTEATLRATIDPSGLPTSYHFRYGCGKGAGEYDQSTATAQIKASAGPTEVAVPIFGLPEGTACHFQVVVENEAQPLEGPDQSFETLEKEAARSCPNIEFRTGRSASLPDCRAYELVTPADTRGATPYAAGLTDQPQLAFNDWLVAPRGETAGEALSFFVDGTLPGFDGNGQFDAYRARRGEGAHPEGGWSSELFSPNYEEAARAGEESSPPAQQGIAADQLYSFWTIFADEAMKGPLESGRYVRTPTGFEPIGMGSLDTDLNAVGYFLSAGGAHVVFGSKAHLEDAAAPPGTEAIYDRTIGGPTSVVSLGPGGSSFAGSATYLGATEDGTAIAFTVGGTLYLHRGGETVEVAAVPNTFAGVSEDGGRVFYTDSSKGDAPGDLFAFDVDAETATEIAGDSIFVNVSADGSHVYFTSEEVLDDGSEGAPDEDNLYVWDGTGIRFVTVLDPQDLVGFTEGNFGERINLARWTEAVRHAAAISPARSTSDGKVLVFQSHGNLTGYDNEGTSQVYRYDALAQSLRCVSCDPGGGPPSDDATLQYLRPGSPVKEHTRIPNVTDNGRAVVFGSPEQLVPEDANAVRDVYEWKAPGEGCKRASGCLALISSGQGEFDNYLYGMTPDGHDVFLWTREKLVAADVSGSPSIYDARVEGGIPDPPLPEPCQGDACQGAGSTPPRLAAPVTTGQGVGARQCPKGKHRAVRHGTTRCVKKRHGRHHRGHHRRGRHRP